MTPSSHFLRRGVVCPALCSALCTATLALTPPSLSASPRFAPDRPGYADATQTVEEGHYHLEFGGGLLMDQSVDTSLILRRGVSRHLEGRLSAPSLSQPLEGGAEALSVGAPSLGVKWADAYGERSLSSVLSLALPLTSSMSASPLVNLTTNLSAPLNARYSYTLTARAALEGEPSALAESAAARFGGAAALGGAWGELGAFTQVALEWTQAGGEELLVGGGLTYLTAEGRQVDLELNLTQLTSEAPLIAFSVGHSLGW